MLTRSTMVALALTCLASVSVGQTILPPYAGTYVLTDLGTVPGVPPNYGGVGFLDNNTLLIGGAGNTPAGTIHRISVTRNGLGQITGFSGTATLYKNAPNIDGGVVFGPGGVLFAVTYSDNRMLQYLPTGGLAPDKNIDLTPLGIAGSTGGLNFVPAGFPGAGGLRIFSFTDHEFYTANLVPDGLGTYNVTGVTMQVDMGSGGPIDFLYVPPGSPVFNPANLYMVLNEWSSDRVSTYQLNALGYPIPATRTTFMNLTGAMGVCEDPVSRDWIFSTWASGANKVVRVTFPHPNPPGPGGPGGPTGPTPTGEGSHPGSLGSTNGGHGEGTYGFGGRIARAPSVRGPRTLAEKIAFDQGRFHRRHAPATLDGVGRLLGPFLDLPNGARTPVASPSSSNAMLAVFNAPHCGGAGASTASTDDGTPGGLLVGSLLAGLGLALSYVGYRYLGR